MTMMRAACLAICLGAPVGGLTLSTPHALAADTDDAAASALVQSARAASGGSGWDRVVGWHEQGRIVAGGLAGSYQTWLDFPHLLSATAYKLGPASGSQGWDGSQAWSTDSSGQVRIERSGEAAAQAIQGAYAATYALFFPGRWPAAIAAAGPRNADGVACDALRVTPKGADPLEVWFDRTSHLVVRTVQLTGVQPASFLFSDFRKAGGLTIPFKTVQRVGGDPKFDQVGTVDSVDLSARIPTDRFAPPPPPAPDAAFPTGRDEVTVPFRLRNNHIYLEASINGKPAPFVFDTGATNILDGISAASLGVRTEGALPGGGFGSAISSNGLAKVRSVAIGGLVLRDQVFTTIDDGQWSKVEGLPSAGLLGYEFAKRAVLTIDYARGRMTFTRPDHFHPPAGVRAIPLTFNAHIPMVEATVDGIRGAFEIDTGARGALTLMGPFIGANHLVDRYHATRVATVGYGTGGPFRALVARAGTLTIGPVTLNAPVLMLARESAGAAAATRTAGNIGGDLLKRFTVTLDYGHQLLWLQPNALAAMPDLFDRAGLWIMRADDGAIAVADVSGGGAAQAAGLVTGDEIVGVDGRKAADVAIYDLREAFKKPSGTRFDLRVRDRSGAERSLVLSLAKQV